jgi:hypothetical protein
MRRKFMFTEQCLYNLYDEDQHDVNKLFGFSIGFHHKNSFRFGWRPLLDERKIEIVAYDYHDGIRQATMPITKVNIDMWYEYVLTYEPTYSRGTKYYVWDEKSSPITANAERSFYSNRKFGLGYVLGTYFGGNEKAPQDIIIYKK